MLETCDSFQSFIIAFKEENNMTWKDFADKAFMSETTLHSYANSTRKVILNKQQIINIILVSNPKMPQMWEIIEKYFNLKDFTKEEILYFSGQCQLKRNIDLLTVDNIALLPSFLIRPHIIEAVVNQNLG